MNRQDNAAQQGTANELGHLATLNTLYRGWLCSLPWNCTVCRIHGYIFQLID